MNKIIILPVGSYEQHGKNLPNTTDAVIAAAVAERVSKNFEESVLLPVINYGCSREHIGFNVLASVQSITFYNYLKDLLTSIIESSDATLIALINGHGGNINVLNLVSNDLNYEHKTKTLAVHPYTRKFEQTADELFGHTDSHAGTIETSIMRYIEGKSEKTILTDMGYKKIMNGGLKYFRMSEISATGVLNDTEEVIIDTEKAKILMDKLVEESTNQINNVLEKIYKVYGEK